jgi:hypothetical protein
MNKTNAGRKPVNPAKKKKQVCVYIEQEIIDKHGGADAIKAKMLKAVI